MTKTALVTGSSGFLGRHFVQELRNRDYSVVECDVEVGVDALKFFSRSFDVQYDLVVHAAAVEPNRAAIDTMHGHLALNLQLDAAMFAWASRVKPKRVLYLSSSAVYPASHQTWVGKTKLHEAMIDKHSGRTPFDDYGWLKLTGEKLADHLNASGVPTHVVRPFSGYGEDQTAAFPFGAFRDRALARQDPFEIWGDAEQTRDWIHVSDVVRGALAIVDADERRPTNLCTGAGTSMFALASLFARVAGYTPEIEVLKDKPLGVAYRVGNPYQMLQHYKPRVTIEEGVERALEEKPRSKNWLTEEYERAKERAVQVPPWARPVVTRPLDT